MIKITFWALIAFATLVLILAVSYGMPLFSLDQLQTHRPDSIALAEIRHVPAKTLLRVGYLQTDKTSSFVHYPTEKPPSVIRIGAFGDSFTHGDEVDEDHDYPSQLSKLLQQADYGNIEVLNFGSGWHGFHQAYIVWDEVARQFDLDYIFLGPMGFWPDRDMRFNHGLVESPYYIHSRFVLKDDDLELVDIDGNDLRERFDAYFSFIPSWNRLRYDRNPPAFLDALLPSGRTLDNPFYYDNRGQSEEAFETYRILLRRLRDSGTPVILANYDRDLIRAVQDLASPSLCIHQIEQPLRFPYRAPLGHNGPSGNDLVARQYMALLTGQPTPFSLAYYRSIAPSEAAPAVQIAAIEGAEIEVDGVAVGAVYTGPDAALSDFRNSSAVSLLALQGGEQSLVDTPLVELDFPITGDERATLRFEVDDEIHEIPLGGVQRIAPNLGIWGIEIPGLSLDWQARLQLTRKTVGLPQTAAPSMQVLIGDTPILDEVTGGEGSLELRPRVGTIHHIHANRTDVLQTDPDQAQPGIVSLALETDRGSVRLPIARQRIERASLDLAAACPGFPHLTSPVNADTGRFTLDLATWTDLGGKPDLVFFDGQEFIFYSDGPAEGSLQVDQEGVYQIVVTASGEAALGELPRFQVSIDGQPVGADVPLTTSQARDYELSARLSAGEHQLALKFTNDAYEPGVYDRNLFIQAIKLKLLSQGSVTPR